MKKKLGLIVNPIAGMGGSVGLKGTDGKKILSQAKQLGAIPTAHIRTIEALKELLSLKDSIDLYTYPHEMGEEEAKACSYSPKIIGSINRGKTTSLDTKNAAKDLLNHKVDLILFVGGDGTARDIINAIGEEKPCLGIPAGVKIYSSVFALNPRIASSIILQYLWEEIQLKRMINLAIKTGEGPFLNNLAEEEIEYADGTKKVIQQLIFPIKSNNHYMFGATNRDVTKFKVAEQELKESEEKFRVIAEQSHIGILIIQDYDIKYSNQKSADIIGYDKEEIESWKIKDLLKLVYKEDQEKFIEIVKKKYQNEISDFIL